jgi:outer membrane protein assembly factor BamB
MKIYFLLLALLGVTTIYGQNSDQTLSANFAANESHTGNYPNENYQTFGDLKWKFATKGKIFSSPAVVNGIAYIGSEDHNLYAIDIKTGKQIWEFTTNGAVNSSPAIYGDKLCFGSFDGYYYTLNAQTGHLLWKFKTGGEKKVGAKGLWTMKPQDEYMNDLYDFFLSSPVFKKDKNSLTVYFGSSDGKLYALDAANGKLKWAYKTKGLIHTSPALYNNNIYFGSWDTYLYALNAESGKLVWKFKTANHPLYHLLEGIQASPTCSNGLVYFGSRDSYFYALNAKTGALTWKYNANGSWVLTTAAVQNGMVYFTTSDSYLLVALDALTGRQKFSYKANGYLYSSPALTTSTAFFGDFTGKLFAVDLETGKLSGEFKTEGRNTNATKVLKQDTLNFEYVANGADNVLYKTAVDVMDKLYTLGPIVSSPVISNGVIYFGSADGSLYAINLK